MSAHITTAVPCVQGQHDSLSTTQAIGLPAAVTDDLALGQSWVAWKLVNGNKVPKAPRSGYSASSTNPATWGTFEAAGVRAEQDGLDGIGIVFNGDGLGGVDLDACRQPDTGEVAEWAMALVLDFNTYTEISPTGTGLKLYARGAPASLPANKLCMDGPPIGGKAPQIEAYVTERWFAVTGSHLACTPDEVVDATEAWERLVYRLRKTNAAKSNGKSNGKVNGVTVTLPTGACEELAARFAVYLASPALGRSQDY
jgi:primase-polymerase (primpol)-like protein